MGDDEEGENNFTGWKYGTRVSMKFPQLFRQPLFPPNMQFYRCASKFMYSPADFLIGTGG